MRWIRVVGLALALAACERAGETDPIAGARAACLSARDPQERIEACTSVIESDEPDSGKSIAFSNRARVLLQRGEVTPRNLERHEPSNQALAR